MPLNKKKPKSHLKEALEKKEKLGEDKENFRISLEDFDSSQKYSSSYRDWQGIGLLSTTLECLGGYCKRPLLEQVDGKKFTIYGDFPLPKDTLFIRPKHVTEDANWARIHVNGPAVIVGHIVGNTFYLVFLDKTHKFWLTKKAKGI